MSHDAAKKIASDYSSQLAGKVVVHISNTVDPANFDRLTVPSGTSGAEEITDLLPDDVPVVKAFNTCFAGP